MANKFGNPSHEFTFKKLVFTKVVLIASFNYRLKEPLIGCRIYNTTYNIVSYIVSYI